MAKKTIFAVQNQHFPICTHPHKVKKKFNFFGVFIGLSEAPWRADSKNVYMSIANIIASGSKM